MGWRWLLIAVCGAWLGLGVLIVWALARAAGLADQRRPSPPPLPGESSKTDAA